MGRLLDGPRKNPPDHPKLIFLFRKKVLGEVSDVEEERQKKISLSSTAVFRGATGRGAQSPEEPKLGDRVKQRATIKPKQRRIRKSRARARDRHDLAPRRAFGPGKGRQNRQKEEEVAGSTRE